MKARLWQRDSRFAVKAFVVWSVFYFVLVSAWMAILPYGAGGFGNFVDYQGTAMVLIVGLVTLWTGLSLRNRERVAWSLMGLGSISWGLGMVIWAYYRNVLGVDLPFPSLADAGYLMFVPLMFAGLVLLPAGEMAPEERLKIGLDAFIAMAAVGAVSWFFLLGPIYSKVESSLLEKIVGLAYPAGDLILVAALMGGMARGWLRMRSPTLMALMVGVVAFIVADVAFAWFTLQGSFSSSNPLALGWPLGLFLIAYAALRRKADGPNYVLRRGEWPE